MTALFGILFLVVSIVIFGTGVFFLVSVLRNSPTVLATPAYLWAAVAIKRVFGIGGLKCYYALFGIILIIAGVYLLKYWLKTNPFF